MIALDTNLLVYAHRAGAPEHDAAKEVIIRAARHGAGWGIASACLAEFWAVVTHPSCPGGPSAPNEAMAFLTNLLEDGGGHVWEGGAGFGLRLMKKATELNVAGPRIFDLQIGLAAYESGAHEIWTNDKQFVRLPGLKVVHPLERRG